MLPAWLAARFLNLLHRDAADADYKLVQNTREIESVDVIIECLEDQLEQERCKRARLLAEARDIREEQVSIQSQIERVEALYPLQ